MLRGRRPWREELEIIDRTMRAISKVSDPEEIVSQYWNGIGELLPISDFVAMSRRGVAPPSYLITRSSRFTEDINPWLQREKLPVLSGGLLGEIAYAEKPVIIDDLPARLKPDDPAYFYIQGFQSIIALPQYDGGEALNITCMLLPAGMEIDPAAIPVLHWQSGLFGRGTQNLVLRNQLGRALSDLDRELQVVGDIQRSLLPEELPEIPGVELAAHYATSARAGGDYYDFFPLPNGGWGIFIADVSGHGTPAAVLMAITHAIAHSHPGSHTPPASLLKHLNSRLTRSYTRSGTFVTAFYAVFDPVTHTLTYSSAGHNPPRLLRNGIVRSIDGASTIPLGIMPDQSFEEARVTLERGDLLLLYTDGITEAMSPRHPNGKTDEFGTEGLDQVLTACAEHSAQQTIEAIRRAVGEFTHHGPPGDDQTVIAMRCRD
jgi:sigma-B regulation protein RsbU (phosphoserine phosphatase)